MTKTAFNIRDSKSDLRLHSFREVLLGDKTTKLHLGTNWK